MSPRPTIVPPTIGRHRDPLTLYSERLDLVAENFEVRARSKVLRSRLYAAIGAVLVVAFGVWGFGMETNTRNATWHPIVRTVTVDIVRH
ncbi:hypothetical protein [Lichenicoccus sp.]|uniref:hypothetical protein n=1 Tax=Lichenicoccus sp. TaxID=2781899 RepID=UPI003D09B9CA